MKKSAFYLALVFCIASAAALKAQQRALSTPDSASPAAASALPLQYFPGLDLSLLDRSVDPCTDLYQFSCGGWLKQNQIPADQAEWDRFGQVEEQNREVLRGILERAAAAKHRDAVEKKIGDFYAACMDEKKIEAQGAKPLQPELHRIAAMRSKTEIAGVLAALHAMDPTTGYNGALFTFGSDQDYKDATQYIAEADQGGLGLPDRDYYFPCAAGNHSCDSAKSAELRRQYVAHVTKMFTLLGESAAEAAGDAQAVMRMETALAQGHMTRVERRDPPQLYHKMSRAQFQQLAPNFDWDAYFARTGLAHTQTLNVVAPRFFQQMNAELASASLADWKTYLRWHLAHALAPYLSSQFVNEDFAFYGKTLSGTSELQPRWKRCVRWADRNLGEDLGQLYVRRMFTPQEKQATVAMVNGIEAAMKDDIRQLPWMSAVTRQQAELKLSQVANKVGYPEKWRDYSKLEIARNDEAGNMERAAAFEFHRRLNKIGKPVDRGEWGMTPPTVNAYYNPQMNDINFPAGILQPPFYDPRMDDAVNYGDTGATVGHELTHAFDDEGRQFDGKGNLRDWWTAADAKQFTERAACISDQYSGYTIIDDIKINGKLTLGEDTADLGGTILAWNAWRNTLAGHEPASRDSFTPEQRFFIGYAQSWCTKVRPEEMRLNAETDPHSPPKYRTNGVVSNMPEFQQAFSCKATAPMVNKDRCRVW